MRSTTTSSRKRGRESTPVRATRLKTGRHLLTEDDGATDGETTPTKNGRSDGISPSSVNGPLLLSDGLMRQSAPVDQPPPSKNRKQQQQQQQQQQQVANGFPVTVFPPADNNNSPPPAAAPPSSSTPTPPAAVTAAAIGGAFQSPRHNNKNSRLATKNSSQATVRLDNNKPEPAATAAAAAAAAATAVSRKVQAPPTGHRETDDAVTTSASLRRQQMKEAFQPWVMQTYGDAAKTKTISRRKSERIARILKGEDRSNGADSSKFRFWVRAKGFRLGPPTETLLSTASSPDATASTTSVSQDDDDLYVVTSTTKDESGGEDKPVYKKVAVVEDFFDIIYREHVEFMNNSGGRPPTGKHAGQKRTYRAITEIYAFLPREAVTRFLMQCADCQRRGNGASSHVVAVGSVSPPSSTTTQLSPSATTLLHSSTNGVSPGSPTPPASPANAPTTNGKPTTIPASTTTTPHHHHHHHPNVQLLPPTPPQQQQQHHHLHHYHDQQQQQHQYQLSPLMLAVTTNNIDLSLPLTSTLLKRATLAGVSHQQLLGLDRAESSFSSAGISSPHQGMTAGSKVKEETNKQINSPVFNGMASTHTAGTTDATSPITLDLSSKTSDVLMDDHSPGAIKDEDDDDDDDVEDRIDTQDPERLKAFNMFVRLFVDENLDRMVPISRQPREKVQAIIDSCLRQFPEFGERARKRIRTYLKSCRRHKRTRDPSGGVQMEASVTAGGLLSPSSNRPMPPHLTSAVAEQILAQACENENQNAKRLRLGLEPISQPLPAGNETAFVPSSPVYQAPEAHSPATSNIAHTIPTSSATPTSASGMTNLFRPAFGPYQRSSNQTPTSAHQGPTDLSTKSRPASTILGPPTSNGLSSRSSPLPHKLNAAEILAVRQLVMGYRESAAFLLRSADELEQLLHQQHTSL